MQRKTKYILFSLSALVIGSAGYYLYTKIKTDKLNKMVSSVPEAEEKIDSINTDNIQIPADASTEPDLPLPNESFSEYGTLDDSNWDGAGGYKYIFSDGSIDFYKADDTFVANLDANGNMSY